MPTNQSKAWDADRTLRAKISFQRLWVAGTLGAFFSAIARTIPTHFVERAWPPDPLYTADVCIRYGYLVWLLAYFFISNLRIDISEPPPTKWDILFDVWQSICGFVAAFALGFLTSDSFDVHKAYLWADIAILAIAIGAFGFTFMGDKSGLGHVRVLAVVFAGASGLFVYFYRSQDSLFFIIAGVFLLTLFAGLLWFLHLKMQQVQKSEKELDMAPVASQAEAEAAKPPAQQSAPAPPASL